MVEGKIVVMSQRTKFNLEEMGGLELLSSALENITLDINLTLHQITEPQREPTYKSRLQLDYKCFDNVSVGRIKAAMCEALRREDIKYQFDVTQIDDEKRIKFFPKRKTVICQWCGKTDCNHRNK